WGDGFAPNATAVHALLGLCATALGPLGARDVLAIGAADLGGPDGLSRAARMLGRFVLGDGEAQGYTFAHPRLREYFRERMPDGERGEWQSRFVVHGKRTVEALSTSAL